MPPIHPVRVSTPVFQPLRSRQVDALLHKAASLLTSSLDVTSALKRLSDLLVPQFADWCSIVTRDEQRQTWRMVRPQHADPDLRALREDFARSWGGWMLRQLALQRHEAMGTPLIVEPVDADWLRREFPVAERDRARRLGARSALFLPLDFDGTRLGAILLLVLSPDRPPYTPGDLRSARRLADFAAAAVRNAKLWETLRDELAQRRGREESLRQSMTTIGTLSSGLGHDMGNVLQALRLRLESLQTMELPAHAESDLRAIGDVMDYLQRLANSLRMLAGDARAESAEHSMTRLRSWFTDVQSLMRHALHHSIDLVVDIPQRLPPARIPAVALTQIVFNLVQNAGQALSDVPGARVRIRAERVRGAERLRLTISDNGPAMTRESLRRIFESHFAPRERPATGLGLALVRTLVEQSGGEISADSGPDGTTFTVTLPIGEARQHPRRRAAEVRIARVTIEDTRTRTQVTRTLQRRGYFVDQTRGAPHRQERVWVTDGASLPSAERLLQFVDRPDRLAVVLRADLPADHPRIRAVQSAEDLEELPLLADKAV
ncbi:MAG TPA: ATP-binding protein [Gemmatimonadaceae bacterium]|nr:ATP-binding protein [Gemmatimonadaceae bacterium]